MSQLNKSIKNKTSIVFNLSFTSNAILSCFLFFFLIINLHFLISAVIAQIFHLTAGLKNQEECKSKFESLKEK